MSRVISSVDENERLYKEIESILQSDCKRGRKLRQLKKLSAEMKTPVAQRHVEYYITLLRKQKRDFILNIAYAVVSAAYLIFTLFRIYWYYYPEKNILPETNFTVSDLITLIFMISAAAVVCRIVKKVVALHLRIAHS